MGGLCVSVRFFPAMKYKEVPRYGLALILSANSSSALQELTDNYGIIFFWRQSQMEGKDNVVVPL